MARKNRNVPEINQSSLADIAFMLLIFFLVTTTMDVDSGIYRKLPAWVNEDQKPPDINERNVFVVGINLNNELFVEGAYATIPELKDRVKEFIINPLQKDDLSEKETKFIEGLGDYDKSKGVVSLTNDRGTDYGSYIRVQNELVAAFNELRDEFCYAQFGMKFKALSVELQEAVRLAIPTAISEAEPVEIKR
ncbi:MAG: biopolymer transporter ExbD [Bacteroidetes bacterium]|jgi:biopolymer transport protein ExbD|nr:biopolymer transporter ExbD [Bacteroidota bacterium]MBT3751488.1 biopolymer transporter ExbD [Bacteroidota bacterium]MBT4399441.1 biopolymer transporter ExbD [Bacteroidota bacterium]MBT4409301.1 biopolymer transporter ExbD [Bacteroidota bacterium]MBT5425603.1 biopolymer transporter ExbD [Bacteroidota bacterium]